MKKTSPLSIVLAFLVVGVPLGWGLYRSIKNSLPLFRLPLFQRFGYPIHHPSEHF